MGPRSRELLQRVSTAALRQRRVPLWHVAGDRRRLCNRARDATDLRRRARLGALRAGRVRGRRLSSSCCAAGRDLGLVNAGYYAIDSLRLEKGYRAWGRELTPDINPFEAGLAFAVRLDRPGFRGTRRACSAVDECRR